MHIIFICVFTLAAFAGPLPSAESIFPKVYLAETEGQSTAWSASSLEKDSFLESNDTLPGIDLNFNQNTRHTRQAETPTLPSKKLASL